MSSFSLLGPGGQQSSSGDSEETGMCIARDDRAAPGLRCVSALVEAAQGSSQGNVTASTLYLCLLLIYIPSWNFSFPRGNSTIVNNAKILQGPAALHSIWSSISRTWTCSWRFSGMGKKARAGQSFVGTCRATAQLQSWLTFQLGKLGQMT